MLCSNCGAGVPGACLAIRRLWEEGDLGVARDYGRAAEGDGDACALLSVEGCRELDRLLAADDSMPRDVGRYAPVLDGACYRRQPDACVGLGKLHVYGIGVPESAARAEELWRRACDLEHGGGCWLVSRLELRRAETADADPTPAFRVEERACALVTSAPASRARPASSATPSGRPGPGTGTTGAAAAPPASTSGSGTRAAAARPAAAWRSRTPTSRAAASRRARRRRASSCGRSATAGTAPRASSSATSSARTGSQTRRSKPSLIWRRACELREGDGCHRLARLDVARGSTRDAVPLYERGCALRAPAACQDLGRLYLDGSGVGRDPARGTALVENGCRLGATGCGRGRGYAAAALR